MARVEVPKGLFVGLAGLAVMGILGIVFIIGREFGRSTLTGHQNNSSGAEPSAKRPSMPVTVVASALQPAPGMQVPGVVGGLRVEQEPPAPSAPIPSGIVIPSSDPMRAMVAGYFHAVETIQPSASGDPETMAQQVVAGLGKGDMSGFDSMIQQAKATRERLSAITPPQPCAVYHLESLGSLDAGLELMNAMRKALSSTDHEASMLNLTDQANSLKVRTEALQLQEKALKQRFGLMK